MGHVLSRSNLRYRMNQYHREDGVPSTVERVHVELGPRSYDIEIGTGNMAQLADRLRAASNLSKAVVSADNNVIDPHASA